MQYLKKLDFVKGGNALALAAIAFRATEYCLGQWEKSRREHHERIDKEMKQYQFEQEMQRCKQLNALKGLSSEDSK